MKIWKIKALDRKLIRTLKNNVKKTWRIIKDSIGKDKYNNQNFPKKVIVDNIAITDKTQIADNFKEIETSAINIVYKYLKQCNTILPDNPVSINELKDAFFPIR